MDNLDRNASKSIISSDTESDNLSDPNKDLISALNALSGNDFGDVAEVFESKKKEASDQENLLNQKREALDKKRESIFEGLCYIENGKILFDSIQNGIDSNGRKFIEIEGKRYFRYEKGMSGLGYQFGISDDNILCLYIGNYKDGIYHGKGTLTWADGDKYVGDFVNGRRTGKGTYTWPSGNKYVGDFVDGRITGKGTFIWTDGGKYVGDYVNDRRTGKGTLYWPNGNKFEGNFLDSKRVKGTFILNPGDNEIRYEVDRIDGKSVIISGGNGSNNGKYVAYGEIVDEWPCS